MLWWDERLTTGVEAIDQQHKSIFRKANQILSLEVTTDYEEIMTEFDFLVDYALEHFSQEEKVMLEYHYEGFKHHRMQHSYFMNEIFDIKMELKEGNITVDVLDKLKLLIIEWLVNHINQEDKALVEKIKK